MYYNTTRETGEALATATRSAASQTQRVLDLFRSMPNTSIHAWTIKTFLRGDVPITSVRRAITDLHDAGKIERDDAVYAGPYRRKTHTYRYLRD
jgi:hypothetical protein